MQIMSKCLQMITAIAFIFLTACAESAPTLELSKATKQSDVNFEISASEKMTRLQLPATWTNMDYIGWVTLLGIKDKCQIVTEGNPSRFMQSIAISEDTVLLLLACELGAYQDGYYAYIIDTINKNITPLVLMLPKENGELWGFTETHLIWGSVWKEDNSDELEVTFLSAATGMCGHRSVYSVTNLIQTEPIVPIRAFADKDCYNGIQVEEWPKIK